MKRAVGRLEGLYGVADADCRPELPMEEKVLAFLEGGASAIQLRMKHAPGGRFYEAARRAKQLIGQKALLIINDRPDVALAVGADGVHVGDEDLPEAVVRSLIGTRLLLGVSARTVEEALAVAHAGADHIGFGPVFPTHSKPDAAAASGLTALAEAVRRVAVPVVAIGGIGVSSAAEVAKAGAVAAAVISDVLEAADPVARARALREQFAAGRREGKA